MTPTSKNNKENLGPAEKIIQTILTYTDHAVHNRPGIVVQSSKNILGVEWSPVSHSEDTITKVKTVYALRKVGKKNEQIPLGVMQPPNKNGDILIKNDKNKLVGRYQPAGLFPEVVTWMYQQISEVWKLDNEFVAKWASYAYTQEHRDLKVVLAAFLLCQARKGEPVLENGKLVFHDEDYRNVGEAMCLLFKKDTKNMDAKALLRIGKVLQVPGVAKINRELGFSNSSNPSNPFMGRWPKVVAKYLQHREDNSKLLETAVKNGWRSTLIKLSQMVGYKPQSEKFFETLRWKQVQAKDGRRTIAIGKALKEAESWQGLSEAQICHRFIETKPNWKRAVGLIPKEIGITKAIMSAAIESGALSDKDLIILTPTIEELGLLEIKDIKSRWERAIKMADDMRAANIAKNVRTTEVKEALNEAADKALQASVQEVLKNLRIYIFVDISGSMQGAIDAAKQHLEKFVQAFPLDRLHISTFNTVGKEINIQHASSTGVKNAFKGVTAGGGTDYASGVRALAKYKTQPDEDAIFIFVGDEQNGFARTFEKEVINSGIKPMSFGFVRIMGLDGMSQRAVQDTASKLEIPCFMIDEKTFDDPYAIPRTIRNLIASTPVGKINNITTSIQKNRENLIDIILKTELLRKPIWA